MRRLLFALLGILIFFPAWGDDELEGKLPRILELFDRLPSIPLSDNEDDPAELAKKLEAQAQKEAAAKEDEAAKNKPKITTDNEMNLFHKSFLLGHNRALKKYLTGIINKLQVPGDSTNFVLKFSLSPFPNAHVRGNEITITAGLLAYVKNEDELAAVIAHEMTHANADQYKAEMEKDEIKHIMNSMQGNDQDPKHREEVRADLGALDRLVQAGYNPWAQYDFQKRLGAENEELFGKGVAGKLFKKFFPHDSQYSSTHPIGEARMALVKAYIKHKSGTVKGLAEQKLKYTGLGFSMRVLQARAKAWATIPKAIGLAIKGGAAYLGWAIVSATGITDSAFGRAVADQGGEALRAVKSVAPGVIDSAWNGFDKGMTFLFIDHLKATLSVVATAISGFLGLMAWDTWGPHAPVGTEAERQRSLKTTKAILEARLADLNKQIAEGNVGPGTLAHMMELAGSALRETNGNNNKLGPKTRINQARQELLDSLAKTVQFAGEHYASWKPEDQKQFRTTIQEGLVVFPRAAYRHEGLRAGMTRLITTMGVDEHFGQGELKALATVESVESGEFRKLNGIKSAELVIELHGMGNYELARRVLIQNFSEIQNDLSSPGAPSLLLHSLEIAMGRMAVRGDWDHNPKNDREVYRTIVAASIADRHLPINAQTLAHMDFRRQIPTLDESEKERGKMTSRLDLEAEENARIVNHLRSFKNLEEVVAYLDKVRQERGTNLDGLRRSFNQFVSSNPHLIQSRADLELLFARNYFWPAFDFGSSGATKIEGDLMWDMGDMSKLFPDIWMYKPADSERLHKIWQQRARTLGLLDDTPESQAKAWEYLIRRGVSSKTDAMFSSFIKKIKDPALKKHLEDKAMQGGVWEVAIRADIVRQNIRAHDSYRQLRENRALTVAERKAHIEQLVGIAKSSVRERGSPYAAILEDISREVRSSYHEAAYLQKEKWPDGGTEQTQDRTFRTFSEILSQILEMPRELQWDFVRFLRGENHFTPQIEAMFPTLGAERVQRMFSVMPVEMRTWLFDSFFDSAKGLLPNDVALDKGYAHTILEHLSRGSDKKSRDVATQVLEAFLQALEDTGDRGFKSSTLAYLLALPPSEGQTSGDVLKQVLEHFGSMGVKLGQFLVAAEILSPEDTEKLRGLQEQAIIPERMAMHKELEEITGRKVLPVIIGELLGSASMKYALSVSTPDGEDEAVLKVLRLSAVVHTETEFKQLEAMAVHLDKISKKRYGVFRAIVKAATAAAKRELSAADEVKRGGIAREDYHRANTEASTFIVPQEILFRRNGDDKDARLIASEFAKGVSFNSLTPEQQQVVGRMILEREGAALFDRNEPFHFDPDRHPGNYRIQIENAGTPQEKITVRPIDFGQLIDITPHQRDQVLKLFALAQIVAQSGSTSWAAEEITKILGLPLNAANGIKKAMAPYFPAGKISEPTAYFTLLAALDDAGRGVPIQFFDFVRGIIQLKPYSKKIQGELNGPVERLTRAVKVHAAEMQTRMRMSTMEKLRTAASVLHETTQDYGYRAGYQKCLEMMKNQTPADLPER